MRRLGHVPALDGIRGIAIAAVVSFHYFHTPRGGYAGVDLFFVLSGFLITTLLLEEHAKGGGVSLRGFYERRIRRLLPAAWMAMLFAVLMGYLVGVAAAFFYVANVYDAVRPPAGGPTGIFWSLSMEEQFYFVWPLALLFLLRRRLPVARILVVAAVAFMLYRVAWLLAGASGSRVYFAPDTHADPLLVGCLLAVLRSHGHWISSRLALPAALALLALVLIGFRIETFAAQSLGLLLTELAAVGLIVAALSGSRLLAIAPLVWLGRISYSLYLWHPIAVHVFSVRLALPVALLLAWASYRWIEQPFRRRRAPDTVGAPVPCESVVELSPAA